MDTMECSSNIDVQDQSSRCRPTSLDRSAFNRGTAHPPSGNQSLSSHSGDSNFTGNVPSDIQPQVTQEQFAGVVIKADSRIPKSKLKDIIYLCHDKVRDRHVLEQAQSAKDIFEDMNVSGSLTPRNVTMISELLHRMGMLRDKSIVFKGTKVEWKPGMPSTLDEFRCLLYSIAEQIPGKDLQKLKAFCSDQDLLEPYLLEECEDSLELFTLLEDEAVIAGDSIGLVKDFANIMKIQKVKDSIQNYEEQMAVQKQPVLAMTKEDGERLMTFRTFLSSKDVFSQNDIIGFEAYQDMIRLWNKLRKGAALAEKESSHNAKYTKMSASLITPSMLSVDGEANQRVKKNLGLNDLKSPEKSKPRRSAAPIQSLKSTDTDIPTDSNSEEDEEELSLGDENDPYTTRHQSIRERRFPIYPMDKNPKGICLIISNKTFEGETGQERIGTEKDVKNLKRTFGEILKFEVHVREDLTAAEMTKELQKWRNHDHSSYNAFICCLLSHGNRGTVMGTDGRPLFLSRAMGYFKGNCPSLVNKPKVFIIQACQGDDWQGVTDQNVPRSPTGDPHVGIGSAITPEVPNEADFVLLLSTVPGFKSARNSAKGSWFIMALTKILKTYPDTEINSAMTALNNELSKVKGVKMDGRNISQTAFPSHTLRKLLFFQQPTDSYQAH